MQAKQEKINYSKYLSCLFSTISIVGLSILSLLNNFTLDLYTAFFMLKIIIPAAFCSWFVGHIIGKILDCAVNNKSSVKKQVLENDEKAYEIPSMFSSMPETADSSDNLSDIGV